MKAPLPPNEVQRLETLRGYDVLDTLPELAFDDLTQLAAQICDVPIAAVSLVDGNRQWFKSTIGLSATETSRDIAFCAHAILNPDELLEVRDAQFDPRFADNPLVTADPHIRFYAGAPLVTSDGFALGTLCVIDREPRALSAEQKTALRALSRTVIAQLELRRTLVAYLQTEKQLQSLNVSLEQKVEVRTAELTSEIEERKQAEMKTRERERRLQAIIETEPECVKVVDAKGKLLEMNAAGLAMLEAASLEEAQQHSLMEYILSDYCDAFRALHRRVLEGETGTLEFEVLGLKGTRRWLETHAAPMRDEAGKVTSLLGITRDITERKKIEQNLRLARFTLDHAQDSLFRMERNARITYANDAACRHLGYTRKELLGLSILDIDPDCSREIWDKHCEDVTKTGALRFETRHKRKDGTIIPVEITTNFMKFEGENHFFASVRDIAERKEAEDEIYNLAFYDALTGLPNRRLLLDRLSVALSVSARSQQYGALLFLDLDNFKTINDMLGHEYGDLLLVDVAKRLKSCVREVDTVARLGGDEFVVLLEDINAGAEDASQNAAKVAEKIRTVLTAPYQVKGREQRSSTSIGVCLYYGKEESVVELLKHADMAMYQAKDAGRNAVRFFDPHMQQLMETHAALESDLRQAITDQQLQLYYQIQVDYEQRPIGAEALVRWVHPQRGIVSPAQFIPLAEESSLILDIGHWVLDTACQQIAAWSNNEQTRDLVLAVNISAKQFKQSDFVEQVAAMIQKCRIDPSRLKLELTESVALGDIDASVEKMLALRQVLGVTLSLDDFGTGYSSLSYLKQLPLDQIKIDQSFVRSITTDASDAVMVKTIIDMAHNFGLNVIAEGVETEAQLDFLRKNGCMAYQGYLFSKPIPIEEFEKFLVSQPWQ